MNSGVASGESSGPGPGADPDLSPGQPRVLVLLPVFNGARYLSAQLDSILAQSWSKLLIVCRDDGSSDDSADILASYAERFPQLHLIQDVRGNLGACASFSLLMQYVLDSGMLDQEPPVYVALSDQDDLWHPHKLARCVAAMQEQEAMHPDMPVAVHSDLRVVDEEGELIAESFAAYQGLNPARNRFAAQLLSNTITGCTALLNAALLKMALPIPPQAIMHDWWLALVASAFGCSYHIDEALVDYRQHDSNTIGAKQYHRAARPWLARLFDNSNREVFSATVAQAQAFAQRYAECLGVAQRLRLRIAAVLDVPNPVLQKCVFRLLRRC